MLAALSWSIPTAPPPGGAIVVPDGHVGCPSTHVEPIA